MSWLLWVAAHHCAATTATPRRPYGAGGGEECSRNGLGMRASLPTTDALFAQEVEQKMNNLLGWFWRRAIIPGSNQTSHRDAACSCRISPGASEFESDLPG